LSNYSTNFSIDAIPSVFLNITFYFTHKVQSQVCFGIGKAQSGIRIFISTTHPKSVIVALLSHIASGKIFVPFCS
jgi:hypothetical protein